MGFGDFDFLCDRAPVPLCSLVGPYDSGEGALGIARSGLAPVCYARSIELANTVIFEVGSAFIHIASILVLLIIIFNVRSKYTAIGRTEILHFFYLFLIQTVLSLVIDSGVTPPGTASYPYFVAAQAGLASALCWCVLYNGLLGFQMWEDGTRSSIWGLRIVCVAGFALSFVIALFTFQGWGVGMSPTNTIALFVVLYIVNALCLIVYALSQFVLAAFVLRDPWGIGAIILGIFFFVVGQVLLYAFSDRICINVKHYLDGIFFATLCNLFAIMMVYKYWDMITKEDLEFSVSNKENSWEVKELLDDPDRRYDNGSEYASSTYALNTHPY
ncbi:chitin synthase export chaperone [Trichomonascus vanleenenianus]|uniref:Chs7p n=1 Tax=Trichomonascus vanleenenianus TaxID=2268995 RepID=UPI003ECB0BBB